MSLQGKIAVITGASSGIGATIAGYFSKEGASLSLSGRRKENLEAVANKCTKTNSVLTTVGDLTERTTRETLVKRTTETFGKIDILVNNAAVGHSSTMQDEKEERYDEVMNVNLKAPFFLTQSVIPYLVESKGSVVNISSVIGIKPGALTGVYGMAKGGLDIFTRALSRELAPEGVRVNSINPGYITGTDLLVKMKMDTNEIKQIAEHFATSVPLGRNGTPEEVAKAVAFLASDNAAFITGQILCVDGGLLQVVPY